MYNTDVNRGSRWATFLWMARHENLGGRGTYKRSADLFFAVSHVQPKAPSHSDISGCRPLARANIRTAYSPQLSSNMRFTAALVSVLLVAAGFAAPTPETKDTALDARDPGGCSKAHHALSPSRSRSRDSLTWGVSCRQWLHESVRVGRCQPRPMRYVGIQGSSPRKCCEELTRGVCSSQLCLLPLNALTPRT